MKAFRIIVSALSGAVFTILNFNVYALFLSYQSAEEGGWNLTIDAVMFTVFVVGLNGLIFGLPFGFIIGVLERSAVIGTVVGVVGGSLVLIYGAATSTGLFADLSLRLLVCFVLTSGLAGMLTSITSSFLCDWRATRIEALTKKDS